MLSLIDVCLSPLPVFFLFVGRLRPFFPTVQRVEIPSPLESDVLSPSAVEREVMDVPGTKEFFVSASAGQIATIASDLTVSKVLSRIPCPPLFDGRVLLV